MENSDFNDLVNADFPVLVSITSRYCDPCFMQKMVIEKVKKNIGKRIYIFSIDAGAYPELAVQYNAIDKPALLLFEKGEILWKQNQILSAGQIIDIVLEKTL